MDNDDLTRLVRDHGEALGLRTYLIAPIEPVPRHGEPDTRIHVMMSCSHGGPYGPLNTDVDVDAVRAPGSQEQILLGQCKTCGRIFIGPWNP